MVARTRVVATREGSWKDSPTKDPKTMERVANFVALSLFLNTQPACRFHQGDSRLKELSRIDTN